MPNDVFAAMWEYFESQGRDRKKVTTRQKLDFLAGASWGLNARKLSTEEAEMIAIAILEFGAEEREIN